MILLDTLQGIRREIGADPELMEALEVIALMLPDLRRQANGGCA